MIDKRLADSTWKKFAKDHDLPAGPLSAALAALQKTDEADPQAMLSALADVDRPLGVLLKSQRDDKAVLDGLDELAEALADQRALALQAALDAGMPPSLSDGVVRALKQVKGGATLNVMMVKGGQAMLVLVTRKAVGPAQRRLLTEQLGVAGAVKVLVGECVFDANAYTFVVGNPPTGLAKQVKAALLAQTGTRFKVALRAAAD